MIAPQLMIVEDDEPLVELLRYNFEAAGYAVETVMHGDEAETRLKRSVPDLLILDWMLPGFSGIELCRRLRQRAETQQLPLIMLTARGEETDRVRGFEDRRRRLRGQAVLGERAGGEGRAAAAAGEPAAPGRGHRASATSSSTARPSGRQAPRPRVHLGPTDYRLLEFLMQSPGRVFSREQLLNNVWGDDVYIDDRTVDVHIGRLRKSLNSGRDQDPIRTVRGAGYSIGS